MFFNKKYIKVNHNEEPEKTQVEEPKQEEAKEAAPVVETVTCKICKKNWINSVSLKINMSAMSADIISVSAPKTVFVWWRMQELLKPGIMILRPKIR